MKKYKNLEIIVQRWTDRVYGNTYFVAQVHLDGNHILLCFQYGYEEHYRTAVKDALYKMGFINDQSIRLNEIAEDVDITVNDGPKKDMIHLEKQGKMLGYAIAPF